MKRALVLAFHFPPSRGSGVYRTLAWANRFAAAGWATTIVTVERDWFTHAVGDTDPGLEELIDPAVTVLRAPLWHEAQRSDVASMSWAHGNFPETYVRWADRLQHKAFPERWGLWYPAATKRALRSATRHRPDVVLGTGNPYATLAATRAVGRLLHVPYLLDYHDAWTMNQVTGERRAADDPAWAWERRLVRRASALTTVNEPLAAWYRSAYPGTPVSVVENGWEPRVLTDLTDPVPAVGPLRFGYVGTLREDLPLEQFLAGWRIARSQGEAKDATLDVYGHLGYFATSAQALLARLQAEGVTYRGPVAQRDLGRIYAGLDALVSLLPSSPYVTSGKVYDYLAALRPIVAVHTPETGATAIGEVSPLWCGVPDLGPVAIAQALERAARLARRPAPADVACAREVAAGTTWAAAMDPFIAGLSR